MANGDASAGEETASLRTAQDSFRGLGTEPFWSVSIADNRLSYDSADGEEISVEAPPPAETPMGRVWRTPRITVEARRAACSDGMSMNLYPAELKVIVDGRELSGCGGYEYRDDLAGTRWQIANITFNEVSGDAYRLEFTDDEISGRAGCNHFSGSYRRTSGGALEVGPLATTRMACPGPQMEHERAALELFAEPVRLSSFGPETLAVGNEVGGLLLRRIR